MREYLLCSVLVLVVLAGNVIGMGKSDGDKKETESSIKKTETKICSKTCAKTCTKEEMAKCAAGAKPDGKVCTKHSHSAKEDTKKCAAAAKPEGKVCIKEEKKPCVAEAKEISAVSEQKVQDKVFVTVNGLNIMQSEIDEQVDRAMAPRAGSMPPEQMAKMRPRAQQQIANMMVDKQLFSEQLKAKKIEIAKEQIDMKIEEIAGQRNMTSADFLKQLESNGLEVSDVREQIGIGLGVDKLMETEAAVGAAVTEEDAKKFYDGNSRRYSQGEQVRASHILLKTEGLDEAGKAAAKAKLEGLLAQVKEGADFAELAKANSDCPSGAGGGDLNFFERGRMVPAFDEAAFALKVNEISGIVETNFGYHIIKQTDRKEAKTTSFEEVKADIVEELSGRKKREFAMKYLEQLKSEANIVWSEEAQKIMQPAPSMARPPKRAVKPAPPAPKEAKPKLEVIKPKEAVK
jgi:peptidyl-prolyl cis-trans isomerase C